MPQGAQIQCSGCHCPGTGPVYACWRCSFFLHDQCFRASRSLKHPSHHLHPLTLTPYPTYPSNSFYCNSCTLIGSGFSYSCSESPEPEPPVGFPTGKDRETTHFSHPHRLKLTEVQEKDGKKCSGCEYIITGPVYTCVDPDCGVDFNLHKKCFELPREVRHKSHLDHALTLLPSPPYQDGDGFACNACLQKGSAFVYHCGACSFDLHVECVRWPEKVQPPVDKPEDTDDAAAAAIQEAQMKLALLQLLVNGGGPIEFKFS
nr:putative DC1, C1-like, Zinc finger, RING/FYVE/PHD-type [Ipomoea batatas]